MQPLATMPGDAPLPAPQRFRDALTQMVDVGMSVMRMLQGAADAEAAAMQAAATTAAADASAIPETLAEAIEADRAAAAAAEARQTVADRVAAIAAAYAATTRAVRRNVLLAERLDRGWARRLPSDTGAAMARRHIARAVSDAIEQTTDGDRAELLRDALAERLDAPEYAEDIGQRPTADIIRAICRDLGLDPATLTPPASPATGRGIERPRATGRRHPAPPPWRPPDG